ncbi:MAG: hypothetical protein DWI06_03725 [Planctomycetota bacterium]|nr:MAG: hypothetical protein DWI06_03725 [Planctomycetota bacterium]
MQDFGIILEYIEKIMKFGYLFVSLVLVFMMGCGSTEIQPVAIDGYVNLDGKPMPDGQVDFSLPGYPPVQMLVKDGRFSGKVMLGINNVKFAVWVANTWDPSIPENMKAVSDPGKKNILPPKFGINSNITADVRAGEKFNFKITSR